MSKRKTGPVVVEEGRLRVYRDGRIDRRDGDEWVTCNQTLTKGRKMVWWRDSDGKSRQKWVHVLVATAYVPNPEGHKRIAFKDGDMLNVVADNLEWARISNRPKTGVTRVERSNQYKRRHKIEHVQFDVKQDAPLNKAILQKAADAMGMPLAQFLLQASAKLILDNLGKDWLEEVQKDRNK